MATRKPAAPKVAPAAAPASAFSPEMLLVAKETLKGHKNRARVAQACQMSEFKVNGIQRRIREVMACTDTKKACEKLLAHVETLASPACEPTEMVVAATPAPKEVVDAAPAWLATIRELEGKLADATQERNGQRQIATSYSLQLGNMKKRAESAEKLLAQARADREEAIARQNGLYRAIVERLEGYFPPDSRDLEWDVLHATVAAMAKRAASAEEVLPKLREDYRQLKALHANLEQRLTDTTSQRENAVRLAARKEAELTELRRILMPAMGVDEENWPAYSLADAAQGVVELSASRLEEISRYAQRVREVSDQLDWRMGDIGKLRAIVMPALGIPPETQAQHSLIKASETLVAAYLERGLQAGELRESLRNRNEQITTLTADLKAARLVSEGEQLAHATVSAALEKLRHRLKAWQVAVVLAAMASALLGAGLSYWGFRR